MRRLRVSLATLLALAASTLGASLAACNACDGVQACRGEVVASVSGDIVRRADGRPVAGVQVELVPTSGVAATSARASAVSDAAGAFQLSVPASAVGEVVADLVVTPPAPYPAFRIPAVRLRSSDRRGEGTVLPRLLVDPYLLLVGQLLNRRTGGALAGAEVTLVPLSSTALDAPPPSTSTNAQGRFQISAGLRQVGVVVADLLVVAPGVTSGSRVNAIHIEPVYFDVPPSISAVFPVGSSLEYFGEIVFRGTRQVVTNTVVTFRRTGGVLATPSTVTSVIGPDGRFKLSLLPESDGELVGQLTFAPTAGAAPVTIDNVRLTTYDSSQVRLARFSYGEQLLYALETFHRGTRAPEPNVDFEFRRTGGVPTQPEVITGRSDAGGRFLIAPATPASGDLIGDLTLRAPGDTTRVYAGVHLRTVASDLVQFGGVWGVGDQLFYTGELWSLTTRRIAPGIPVMFRRTGGITLLSDTASSVSDASGRFSMFLRTHERGEVVGELVVSPPGGPVSVLPGVRLATYPTDDVRFAGIYGYGPSLLYVLEVLRAGTDAPVAGAQVEFVRTGGIASTPDRSVATSDASGRVPLGVVPGAFGELIGTVTVRPPPPWRDTTFVFTNVRATTFETGDLRLLTTFRIPPPP
jgi:hypothetical protein